MATRIVAFTLTAKSILRHGRLRYVEPDQYQVSSRRGLGAAETGAVEEYRQSRVSDTCERHCVACLRTVIVIATTRERRKPADGVCKSTLPWRCAWSLQLVTMAR